MASTDIDTQNHSEQSPRKDENDTVDNISVSLQKLDIQHAGSDPTSITNDTSPKPLIYLRPQILHLSKSPLVKIPDGMPPLRDWFGDWTEQQIVGKKDLELNGVSAAPRDRRFRRDPEDGDAPTRPSFRSTLSQPSQMGNFRHQSTRAAEREKDLDRERERERDIRDKEGQERLRSLSDKYDRDRLALSSTGALRAKDRESAPHIGAGRDLSKRKFGESSDDWRRGTETSRGSRDERIDSGRRDRDRPRSRSRQRREPSTSHRERDRDERDRDGGKSRRIDDRDDRREDFGRRGDRERDDTRDEPYRDRYDYPRRDLDRETDDDSRRWRDDGKRDERLAARRDRERERGWDRWEPSYDRDRGDDRDTRGPSKRARDKRNGTEEGREKDDRREREREREKEKEPAWMETYVPPSEVPGILGGKSADGELDGIQAWKKGLKEKEKKDQVTEASPVDSSQKNLSGQSLEPAHPELDEIQLFKLMMKKEAEKKDDNGPLPVEENGLSNGALHPETPPIQSPSVDPPSKLESRDSQSSNAPLVAAKQSPVSTSSRTPLNSLTPANEALQAKDSSSISPQGPGDVVEASQLGPRNFPPNSTVSALHSTSNSPTASVPSTAFNPPAGSRLLAFGSRGTAAPSNTYAGTSKESMVNIRSSPIPSGSSVLNPQKLAHGPPLPNTSSPMTLLHSPALENNLGHETSYTTVRRATPSERSARSFSPFSQLSQPSYGLDETHELVHSASSAEQLRRLSIVTNPDRAPYGAGSDAGSSYSELVGPASGLATSGLYDGGSTPGGSYPAGKGSRFAKFFDAKTREPQGNIPSRNNSAGVGYGPAPPHLVQRQDQISASNMIGDVSESRAMEDIFAMLQNSAQGHRVSPQVGQPMRMQPNNGPYGQSSELHPAQLRQLQQQQHQQQQQFAHNNRLDSLYDNRLEDNRNFVPDGMVPGLRPAPRPRSRGPSTGVLFNDQIDDPLLFNVQQRVLSQQRQLDPMYGAPSPSLYTQHTLGRVSNPQMQQPQFRGAPSPISSQNSLHGVAPQRLPPGLANLGGRPPHDPSQFLGSSIGVPGGMQGGLHNNPSAPQAFSNFGGAHSFNNPQARGPLQGPHHQPPLPLNQMNHLSSNNVERTTHAQLLSLGNNNLGGIRTGASAFNAQHAAPPIQLTQMALRQQQQQQQQFAPHLLPHLLQPHVQQQQGLVSGNTQGAQDLMALLMGGHRD